MSTFLEADKFAQLQQPPIFVVGPARSGTTWVYDIFTKHPAVAGVYESWLFTPTHGLRTLFGDVHYPKRRSGLGYLIAREKLLDYTRTMAQVVMSEAIEPNHHYIVEKSPNHIFNMLFIKEIFPDARFVVVIRDGRDVVVSVRAASKSWMPAWGKSFGRSLLSAAHAWRDTINFARNAASEMGNDYMEIRYEEIHSEPLKSYEKLYKFAGIKYDDEILKRIFEATDFQQNYKGGEHKFRRGGRVGDWHQAFSRIDTALFKSVAGQLLIELGYEHDLSWHPRRNKTN